MVARYREINLDLTLYVSFSLPMFRKDRECWIKVHGHGAGAKICECGGLKCYGNACSERLLSYVAGYWIDIEKGLGELEGEAEKVADEVVKEFYCLSIAASPWDSLEILTSSFLSRNTDYHKNTVKWVRTLLNKLELSENGDEKNIMKAAILTYRQFRSYQLQQLIEVLDDLLATTSNISLSNPSETRKRLLKVKYIGPKVADSFILHSGLDQSRAPVDVHYLKFLKRHRLLKQEYAYPQKDYCVKYECASCSLVKRCVYAHTARLFKSLNGFIQTSAYVMDKLKVRNCGDIERINFDVYLKEACC